MDWSHFTVRIPEQPFLDDPLTLMRVVYQLTKFERKFLYENLLIARLSLLWNVVGPNGVNELTTRTLLEVRGRCLI
jgi:hypothetical protein